MLLVEGQPTLRRLARQILEHEGYAVLEANDGHQALALAERHAGPIDVLLTDLQMVHMSGTRAGGLPGESALRAARRLHVGFCGRRHRPPLGDPDRHPLPPQAAHVGNTASLSPMS